MHKGRLEIIKEKRSALKVTVTHKGKGAGLRSDIKSEDLPSDFTFYLLITGPVHLCTISTSRRAYSPAAVSAHLNYRISVLPSTHFQVKSSI